MREERENDFGKLLNLDTPSGNQQPASFQAATPTDFASLSDGRITEQLSESYGRATEQLEMAPVLRPSLDARRSSVQVVRLSRRLTENNDLLQTTSRSFGPDTTQSVPLQGKVRVSMPNQSTDRVLSNTRPVSVQRIPRPKAFAPLKSDRSRTSEIQSPIRVIKHRRIKRKILPHGNETN